MSLQEELERRGNWLFKHRGTLPIIILLFGLIVNIYQKTMNAQQYNMTIL